MFETIPKMVREIQAAHPDLTAQLWKNDVGAFNPTTYRDFYAQSQALAAGLMELGAVRGDHIGIISDNRKEWLIADIAVLSLGAADVPRGRDAMPHELEYILGFSGCRICFAENEEQLSKIAALLPNLPELKTLIVMSPTYEPDETPIPEGVSVLPFSDVAERGAARLSADPTLIEHEIDSGGAEDLATIIFTSGTTGEPKGVMISHRNFLHQVEGVPKVVDIRPGDRWLSVLPVWHSFERILQYVILGTASAIAYSKPIGKIMLPDFQYVNPAWMGSVPRIWESVMTGVYQNVRKKSAVARGMFSFFVTVGAAWKKLHNMLTNRMPQFRKRFYPLDILVAVIPFIVLTPFKKLGDVLVFKTIRAKLGKNFKAGVSGGGSLSASVDRFFSAIGITLLDGYGLTETSPIIGLRPIRRQIPSTVGVFPGTDIRILDEVGNPVKPGEKGVIYARGAQVMMGYYKREDLTRQILDTDGWLNTGDIGMWTHTGEYAIRGRAKDTIVLSGGENIEPVPIEAKLRESRFIEQAVVIGQDMKYLGALIVPDKKELEVYMKDNGIPYISRETILEQDEVRELINSEIESLVSSRNGFKSFEHIFRFALLDTAFEAGKELSAKQEVKRHAVAELYRKEIDSLFK
jgi:long-chain acyl-CoA synthetase